MKSNIDVLVISHNDAGRLRRVVGSLIQTGIHEDCWRLIVVDNHSIDKASKQFLDDLTNYIKIFVLRTPKPVDEYEVVNDGITLSRAKYLLFVHSPIDQEEYKHACDAMLRNEKLGAVSLTGGILFSKIAMNDASFLLPDESPDDYMKRVESLGYSSYTI